MFLDSPFLETGLSTYHEPLEDLVTRFALADRYQNGDIEIAKLVKFAKTIGVQTELRIVKCPCTGDLVNSAPGRSRDNGTNDDYEIEGLKERVTKSSLALSCLVWKTVMRERRTNWFTAKYSNNKSHKPIEEPSQIICMLRDSLWVPQSDGRFVRPADAEKDLLPDDFEYAENSPWLKEIQFGQETENRIEGREQKKDVAKSLGFSDEVSLEFLLRLLQMPMEDRTRFIHGLSLPPSFEPPKNASLKPSRPVANSHNPASRQLRVAENAKNAEPVDRQVRPRTMRKNSKTKKEARIALRRLCTNIDDQLVCQVCELVMPFKKNNGSYYFAAVECVLGLDRELPENHIALCPLCAAMFWHANSTPSSELQEAILVANSLAVPVTLAGQECGIHFTEIHLQDLQTALREVGR